MELALRHSAWHQVLESLQRPYKATFSVERGPLGYINSQQVNTWAKLLGMILYIFCICRVKSVVCRSGTKRRRSQRKLLCSITFDLWMWRPSWLLTDVVCSTCNSLRPSLVSYWSCYKKWRVERFLMKVGYLILFCCNHRG